jgi:hypothetical protein
MSEGASLKSFKARQKSQLNDRSMDAFYPVNDYVIDRSHDAYKATYRSIGFQSFIAGFQHRAAPVIYLHAAARAMFLLDCENGSAPVGPSQTFNHVSEELLELLDAAIADIPTDLLVLMAADNTISFLIRELRATRIGEAIIKIAADEERDESRHSLIRRGCRFLRAHCEARDQAGFLAFRRAVLALDGIGLFENDAVSPLALDFFPSLAMREHELLDRRNALKWRPESPKDAAARN